jgi:hypothetical protein
MDAHIRHLHGMKKIPRVKAVRVIKLREQQALFVGWPTSQTTIGRLVPQFHHGALGEILRAR